METQPPPNDSPKVFGEVCYRKQRRKRQKILIIELLYEYASNSTLHGLRYIVDRSLYIIEKLFWLLTFLMSVGMCFYLITKVWIKWKDSPVIVSFSERVVPVGDVPFPSITICPQLKVKASVFNFSSEYLNYMNVSLNSSTEYEDAYNKTILHKLDNLALVCGKHLYYIPQLTRNFSNEEVVQDLINVAPKVDDVFWYCLWRGNWISCDEIFSTVLTREGVCFNFNALSAKEILRKKNIQDKYLYLTANRSSANWSVTDGYTDFDEEVTYPKRGRENIAEPDLTVVLRESNGDKDDMCNVIKSGYTVYVQHPADLPQSSLYYYAALPGQVSSLALKFKMLMTDDNLEKYSPEVRQCYYPYEKKLEYFSIYTPNNCRLECESKYTFKRCGCVWFHMPHRYSDKICTSYEKLGCVEKAYDELSIAEIKAKKNITKAHPCGCLPSCASVEYDAEILKTDFNFLKALEIFNKMYNMGYDEEDNEISSKYSKIDVYFKEPRFVSMRRSELFGLTDFLANCGGLLGLFLGFSFLSLVEIFYFITIRLFAILRRDLKEENFETEKNKRMD